MAFPRTIFLNAPADCAWLLAKHSGLPSFGSFVLHGNEDAPEQLDLYAEVKPAHNHQPVATLIRDSDGNLTLKGELK